MNDWLEISLKNSDSTFADLYLMGVDPSGINLKSKDEYKNLELVQSTFKGEDGKFDEKAFGQYYDATVKSMNVYKDENFDFTDISADLYFPSAFSVNKKKVAKERIRITNVEDNPFMNRAQKAGSTFGLLKLNEFSAPTKSEREVAQTLNVIDGDTKEQLDYTPEDTGIDNGFGFFRKNPLVLATYNEDVVDENGKVIHKKGEPLYGKDGLRRYETLNGRDLAGKELLSAWDTITEEGSFFNSINFMESDDLDKTITGTVAKSAFQIAPYVLAAFGGGALKAAGSAVSSAMTLQYAVKELVDAGIELNKSVGSLAGVDFSKSALNNVQGIIRQTTPSTSEEGKDHMFGFEGIVNMATDSFFQLKGQRAVMEVPARLKGLQLYATGKFKAASIADDLIKSGTNAEMAKKIAQGMIFAQQQGKMEKAMKAGSLLSSAYMAMTSATEITDAAKQLGLDPKDAALMHIAYMGGLSWIFKQDLGDRMLKGIGIDGFANAQKKVINENATKFASLYQNRAKAAATNITNPASDPSKLSKIVEFGKTSAAKMKDIMTNRNDVAKIVVSGAIGEGFEEVTEYTYQKGIEAIYNGLNNLGYTNTDQGVKYKFDAKTILTEALSTAAGGAIGGAVFKGLDYKQIKSFLDSNQDFGSMVFFGQGQKMRDIINKSYDEGTLAGDKTLSSSLHVNSDGSVEPNVFDVGTEDDNQQKAVRDNLLKVIDTLEGMMQANGLKDINASVQDINKYYNGLVDAGIDTDIYQTLSESLGDIFKSESEINSFKASHTSTTGSMSPEDKTKLDEMIAKQKEQIEEYKRLTSPESTDEYVRQGLFNSNDKLKDVFSNTSKNKLTRKYSDYNTFAELAIAAEQSEEAKKILEQVNQEYDLYTGKEGGKPSRQYREDLRDARRGFEGMNESMVKFLPEFEEYKKDMEGIVKFLDDLEIEKIFQPGADDLSNIGELGKFKRLSHNVLANLDKIRTDAQGKKHIPEYLINQIELIKNELQKNIQSIFSDKTKIGFNEKLTILKRTAENINAAAQNQELQDAIDAATAILATPSGAMSDDRLIASYIDAINRLSKAIPEDSKNLAAKVVKEAANAKAKYVVDSNNVDAIVDDIFANNPNYYGMLDYLNLTDDEVKEYYRQVLLGEDITNDEILDNEDLAFLEASELMDSYSGVVNDMSEIAKNNNLDDLTASRIKTITDAELNEITELTKITDELTEQLDTYTKAFDLLVDMSTESLSKRRSPLSDILKPYYELLEQTQRKMLIDGAENFANSNDAFVGAINDAIDDLEKIKTLVYATTMHNKLVNKFRDANKTVLPDTIKDERLVEMDSLEASFLLNELENIQHRFDYIARLNNYNINNSTKNLLKEGKVNSKLKAKKLISLLNSQSVQDLITEPEFSALGVILGKLTADNYPSLFAVSAVDSAEDISDALGIEAFKELVGLESDIYNAINPLLDSDDAVNKNKLFKAFFTDNFNGLSHFEKVERDSQELPGHTAAMYIYRVLSVNSNDVYNSIIKQGTDTFVGFDNYRFAPLQNQIESAIQAYSSAFSNPWLDAEISNLIASKMDYPNSAYRTTDTAYIQGPPGAGKTSATLSLALSSITSKTGKQFIAITPKDTQFAVMTNDLEQSGLDSKMSSNSGVVEKVLDNLSNGLFGKLLDVGKPTGVDYEKDRDKFNKELEENLFNVGKTEKDIKDILVASGLLNADGTANGETIAFFDGVKTVVFDEVTHIDNRLLVAFNILKDSYNIGKNRNEKVNFIWSGDDLQMGSQIPSIGIKYNVGNQAVPKSPRLTAAIRSKYDIINEPLAEVQLAEERIKMAGRSGDDPDKTKELKDSPFKLKWTNKNNELIGFKSIKKAASEKTELGDIQQVLDEFMKVSGSKLLYIVQDEDAKSKVESEIRRIVGNRFDDVIVSTPTTKIIAGNIATPEEAQSNQAEYVIIDASPVFKDNYKNLRVLEFWNTMLSRTKTFGLVIDRNESNGVSFESIEVAQAQIQNKFTDSVIQNFKDKKTQELQAIDGSIYPVEYIGNGSNSGIATIQTPDKMERTALDSIKSEYNKIETEVKALQQHNIAAIDDVKLLEDIRLQAFNANTNIGGYSFVIDSYKAEYDELISKAKDLENTKTSIIADINDRLNQLGVQAKKDDIQSHLSNIIDAYNTISTNLIQRKPDLQEEYNTYINQLKLAISNLVDLRNTSNFDDINNAIDKTKLEIDEKIAELESSRDEKAEIDRMKKLEELRAEEEAKRLAELAELSKLKGKGTGLPGFVGNRKNETKGHQNISYFNIPVTDAYLNEVFKGIDDSIDKRALYHATRSFALNGWQNNTNIDKSIPAVFYGRAVNVESDKTIGSTTLKAGESVIYMMAEVVLSNGKKVSVPISYSVYKKGGIAFDGKDSERYSYNELFGGDEPPFVQKPYNLTSVVKNGNNQLMLLPEFRKSYDFINVSQAKVFTIPNDYVMTKTPENEHIAELFDEFRAQFSGKAFSWMIADKELAEEYNNNNISDEDMLMIYLNLRNHKSNDSNDKVKISYSTGDIEVEPFGLRPLLIKENNTTFSDFAMKLKGVISKLYNGTMPKEQAKSEFNMMLSRRVKSGIARMLFEIYKNPNIAQTILAGWEYKNGKLMDTEGLLSELSAFQNQNYSGDLAGVINQILGTLFNDTDFCRAVDDNDPMVSRHISDTDQDTLNVKLSDLISAINNSSVVNGIQEIINKSVELDNELGQKINQIFPNGIEVLFPINKNSKEVKFIKPVFGVDEASMSVEFNKIEPPVVGQIRTFFWNNKVITRQAPQQVNKYTKELEAIKKLNNPVLTAIDIMSALGNSTDVELLLASIYNETKDDKAKELLDFVIAAKRRLSDSADKLFEMSENFRNYTIAEFERVFEDIENNTDGVALFGGDDVVQSTIIDKAAGILRVRVNEAANNSTSISELYDIILPFVTDNSLPISELLIETLTELDVDEDIINLVNEVSDDAKTYANDISDALANGDVNTAVSIYNKISSDENIKFLLADKYDYIRKEIDKAQKDKAKTNKALFKKLESDLDADIEEMTMLKLKNLSKRLEGYIANKDLVEYEAEILSKFAEVNELININTDKEQKVKELQSFKISGKSIYDILSYIYNAIEETSGMDYDDYRKDIDNVINSIKSSMISTVEKSEQDAINQNINSLNTEIAIAKGMLSTDGYISIDSIIDLADSIINSSGEHDKLVVYSKLKNIKELVDNHNSSLDVGAKERYDIENSIAFVESDIQDADIERLKSHKEKLLSILNTEVGKDYEKQINALVIEIDKNINALLENDKDDKKKQELQDRITSADVSPILSLTGERFADVLNELGAVVVGEQEKSETLDDKLNNMITQLEQEGADEAIDKLTDYLIKNCF